MNTIRIIICLLFAYVTINAQDPFERLYVDDTYEYTALDVVHLPNGSYYTYSAVKHKDSTHYAGVNITMLTMKGDYDKNGFSRDYFIDEKYDLYPEGSMTASLNGLVMSFTSNNADTLSKIVFKTDFNGEILWSNEMSLRSYDETETNNEKNELKYNPIMDRVVHINNTGKSFSVNQFDENSNSFISSHLDISSNTSDEAELVGDITWTKHDSAYIFCGMTDSESGSFFINKLKQASDTANVETEWSYSYEFDSKIGYASGIVQMNDSLYITTFNLKDENGKYIGYIMGVDSLGTTQWSRTMSYPAHHLEIKKIVNNNDDKVKLAIHKIDTMTLLGNVVMAEINTSGVKQWEKGYEDIPSPSLYNGNLKITSDQNLAYITTGYDEESMEKLPNNYLIVTDLEGMTPCNQDVNEIQEDSTALFSKDLEWTIEKNDEPSSVVLLSEPRSVTPYSAMAEPTIFCPNEEVIAKLDGFVQGATSYLWSNEASTDTTTVYEIGQYSIEVTVLDKYCYSLCDTVTLSEYGEPKVTIISDNSSFCVNDNFVLFAEISSTDPTKQLKNVVSFLWSTGEVSQFISVTELKEYSVEITDGCGQTATAIYTVSEADIPQIPMPDVRQTALDLEDPCFKNGSKILKLENSDDYDSILWSTGETSDSIIVFPGTYNLTVNGCDQTFETSISITAPEDCNDPLQFPNAFVPNESMDGFEADKIFAPVYNEDLEVSSYKLVIVNRWGQIVFESDDHTKGWNGDYKDEPALSGSYFYKAVYTTEDGDFESKGGLVLVK